MKPFVRSRSLFWICMLGIFLGSLVARAGSWSSNASPVALNLPLLLSDGSILIQKGPGYSNYSRLFPDNQGHYLNGNNWSTNVAPMPENRQMFASDVLTDGRIFVAGGEYGTSPGSGHRAAIYNPVGNFWTPLNVPTNWLVSNLSYTNNGNTVAGGFSDAPSIVLEDGSVLIVPIYPTFGNTALIYHPGTDTWSLTPPSLANLNEAGLNKLPDGSILAIDKQATTTERYIPSLGQWIADAPTPINIYSANAEIGASLLLPNGKVFFLGGTGTSLYYTPSGSTSIGTWTIGPSLPNGLVARDAPAALLPNGSILCALTPTTNDRPIFFFEYDPATQVFQSQTAPDGNSFYTRTITDQTEMLVLPDGNVLFTDSGVAKAYVYQPAFNTPASNWKPVIQNYSFNAGGTIHVTGLQMNGLSQGSTFGDDNQNDSNYPLVRFTDGSGNITYGYTYNWSSTGVQTGNKPVTTECALSGAVAYGPGAFTMQVVANGIASDPVGFPGPVWVDFNFVSSPQNGTYSNPFNTLAQGINVVAAGAEIFLKPGNSHETMNFTKAMNLVAVGGTATIGH